MINPGIQATTVNSAVREMIMPVRHGLLMAISAMILGISWAGYLATHHEQLHGGFEEQEVVLKAQAIRQDIPGGAKGALPQAHVHGADVGHHDAMSDVMHQHSHSGSPATDAMQRLMRGHIHWMGLGILAAVLLLIVAFTSLKNIWKKTLAWTFGIGSLAYPAAWILMGFRTVSMGGETAEASVMWLFGPAAGLLLASLTGVFFILLLEMTGWHARSRFRCFFEAGPCSDAQ